MRYFYIMTKEDVRMTLLDRYGEDRVLPAVEAAPAPSIATVGPLAIKYVDTDGDEFYDVFDWDNDGNGHDSSEIRPTELSHSSSRPLSSSVPAIMLNESGASSLAPSVVNYILD